MTTRTVGWETDVVFGGKNIKGTLERLPIVGCAGQLLIINAIFRFSLKTFLSNARTHSSNRALSIQLFYCDLYHHGRDLTFLKHRGFLDFPITNIGSFSPTTFVAATSAILILLCFPPSTCQASNGRFCLVDIDLSLKRPNSSVLCISSKLYWERRVGKDVSYQDGIISGCTELILPT